MSAKEEIDLLERVLLRLGSADTDEQLENTVNKFLSPVLLKITSPNETVRCKVMEILTHINKRLKSRSQITIHLEPLLKQYQDSDSSFLLNFAIIYITMGFPRLSIEKQTEIAPIILNCLEGKPETHQDKLMMLILPLLGEIKIPQDPEKRDALLGLTDKPNTKASLLTLLMDVLLLPFGLTQEAEVPPGMSQYSFKRVMSLALVAENLEHMKKGIVRFLTGSGVFHEMDTVVHLIVASADTRFSVATPALAELNKISTSLDWSSTALSNGLYIMLSGNYLKIVDRKTSPCNARVKQKLLTYMQKLKGDALNVAKGTQVIFETLFGQNTNQKSKVLALQFTQNLIGQGQKDTLLKISKVLLTGISKLIGNASGEGIDVQSAAYQAVAQLATVFPNAVNQDVQLVVQYFNNLTESQTELHGPIREALVALAQAFNWKNLKSDAMDDDTTPKEKFIPNSHQLLILGVLTDKVDKAEVKSTVAQNVASIFLTTCFPDYFVPARYLLLLIAGSSPSLNEMITSYLYGVSRKDHINYSYISSVEALSDTDSVALSENELTTEQRHITLPVFKDMVNYIHEMAEKKLSNPSEGYTYGTVRLSYTLETYAEILDYLRICLWFNAGANCLPGEEKKKYLLGNYIKKCLADGNIDSIEKYNNFIKKMIVARKGVIELNCLFDLVDSAAEIVAKNNGDLMDQLAVSLKEVSENNRSLVAKNYGILLAFKSNDVEFEEKIKDLLALEQKSLEHKHGAVLAVSYAIYRRLLMKRGLSKADCPKYKETVNMLTTLLGNQTPLLISAAIQGIGLIGSADVLPLLTSDDAMEIDDSSSANTIHSKAALTKKLFALVQSGHTKAKIREESALCLGLVAIGDKTLTSEVLNGFLKLIKMSKDPSLHIAMAQAIVFIIQGTTDVERDVAASVEFKPSSEETLCGFLDDIIKIVPDPHTYSRQACGIWLMALVKNCCQRKSVLDKKQILQLAFTDLLSEDSEIVQDVASRGLGIIFSVSDESTQEQLSNSLLEQLTGGRKDVKKVNEDTKVFEEGVLGKAPTGGNLSTYKELCSLASDLNQPEMIYQFMQLANNNAAWNSKLGAAFGLQSISKVAKLKMEPYLGKIVPRLFRYKYDPTPKIQNSMVSIWDSVVVDSKSTIEMYYWEILYDVSTNLTSSEWRTRIACALAVRDLIKRPNGLKLRSDDRNKNGSTGTDKMETDEVPEPELAFLWSQLFRVMDDIHEGTRLAAEGTANSLGKVCVIASSKDHGQSGLNVSSSILPLFLNVGVTNTVPEIRKLSIKTISELIESAGALIVPHLADLVPCLLRATGELDSTKLTYLSTMLGGQSGSQEVVDSMRAEAAKQHYTMDTLSKCIRHIDYEALEKMTPAVLDLMKQSVNLGTKIACAHFLCLISVHIGKEMTPMVGKYLNACFSGLSDRNSTVRKYNASAIGHLAGIAKEQSILNLFKKLNEIYFEHQSNKSKAVALTIQAINKRHNEILKDYSQYILPLIFFAMHEEINDENKSIIELWQELWNEVASGDSAIRLNLNVIVENLEQNLENSSWLLKAQSANSIKTLATRLTSQLADEERKRLIDLLLNNIGGRTFKGKERLVQALSSLCKNWKVDPTADLHLKLVDAVMKECRKEEPVYRTHSLKALGEILDELKVDRFEEVYQMVWFLLDKQDLNDGESSASTTSSYSNIVDEKNKQKIIFINLKETVCEALGKAWPANSVETQRKYQVMFVEKCVAGLETNTRPVQLSLLVALKRFLEKLHLLSSSAVMDTTTISNKEKKPKVEEPHADDAAILDKICQLVLSAIAKVSVIPHTGLKKEALDTLLILINRLMDKDNKTELALVHKTFGDILVTLQKDHAPEIKCRLREIESKLKQ